MLLIKIGKKQHLERLQYEGRIYMNPINYFRNQFNRYRGDKYEGLTALYQSNGVTLYAGNKQFKIVNQLKMYFPDDDAEKFTNIFSYMSFTAEDTFEAGQKIISKKMKKFGDWVLIIYDGIEFIKRVEKKLKELLSESEIFNYAVDRVQYIDTSTYNGPMDLFKKDFRFSYQREGRICVQFKHVNIPFELEVGRLCNISKLVSFGDLTNKVKRKNGLPYLDLV